MADRPPGGERNAFEGLALDARRFALNGIMTWVRQAESGVPMPANAALLYGEIDGFTQIPRGGQPGTTTAERPTRSAVLANASRER
jgi:hypothetical protein